MITRQEVVALKEVELRGRYFRTKLEVTPSTGTHKQPDSGPALPFNNMDGALAVLPDSSIFTFPPAGHCIYCGATEYAPGATRPLGEEHIISEGIGGTIIFPEASCREC